MVGDRDAITLLSFNLALATQGSALGIHSWCCLGSRGVPGTLCTVLSALIPGLLNFIFKLDLDSGSQVNYV